MNSLTPFGKVVGIATLALALILLIICVIDGTKSQECEALYNQYSSASDMGERANIFEKGIDNGCFHYN